MQKKNKKLNPKQESKEEQNIEPYRPIPEVMELMVGKNYNMFFETNKKGEYLFWWGESRYHIRLYAKSSGLLYFTYNLLVHHCHETRNIQWFLLAAVNKEPRCILFPKTLINLYLERNSMGGLNFRGLNQYVGRITNDENLFLHLGYGLDSNFCAILYRGNERGPEPAIYEEITFMYTDQINQPIEIETEEEISAEESANALQLGLEVMEVD